MQRHLPAGQARRRLYAGLVAGLALLASGCASLRYYAHVTHGEVALLAARRPIAAVVADPHTSVDLRERLRRAQAARAFASAQLALPHNRSYTSYVQLDRPYVVWNVFATPEFSVDPLTHCFPFAGCVAYRGYFDEAGARGEAARLAARGDDTAVLGVVAYSTLGWFADPVLSSMLRWGDDELDGVIFHELAHQLLYVRDDTAFNESYATFVQDEGLREWRAAHGLPARDDAARAHDTAFTRLVLDLRERLRRVYASGLDATAMRAAKQREFKAFRTRYAALRDGAWPDDHRHDRRVAGPLNNADLVPFGLYDRWVPAFARLFSDAGRNWPAFHARVKALARLPRAERDQALARLAPDAAG
ncbi:MAG: aminopeptidase [Rhodanobacteraceae bacterium]|jgi:predicted aminopeptidase|nr:aminopeptidase [Rhodanobacteraceae bacterium]